jgi:hypothetical protein
LTGGASKNQEEGQEHEEPAPPPGTYNNGMVIVPPPDDESPSQPSPAPLRPVIHDPPPAPSPAGKDKKKKKRGFFSRLFGKKDKSSETPANLQKAHSANDGVSRDDASKKPTSAKADKDSMKKTKSYHN